MNRASIFALTLVASLVGCSSADKKDDKPDAVMEGYADAAAVVKEAGELLTASKFDDVSKLKVIKRLEELLSKEDVKLRVAAKTCSGVGIFSSGGGGLILKVTTGVGMVSFADGSRQRRLDSKSFLVGAVIGGGKNFGAFLVFDAKSEADVEGDYRTTTTGGAVGETSFSSASLTPSDGAKGHEILAVGTGAGFGGDAGFGKVSVRFTDPKADPGEKSKDTTTKKTDEKK